MAKFGKYKIDLKGMQVPTMRLEYELDNQFFADIDSPEVGRGHARVSLDIKKLAAGNAFELNFAIEGTVVIQCDRCLDDMDQCIAVSDKLLVKMGTEYAEDGDWVIIPEEEGEINVAWFIYEFIVLGIPMKHVHAPGKCNKTMAGKLNKHLRVFADEEDIAGVEMEEYEDLESTSQISDPRWNELKKILDNN
ncbi:MAG: DUF177 domain-containing protein [Bacteroidaceae bacterium]|nr:DUF177 domain-containing protein [Bacteroidaceae bacterium]